MKFAGNDFMQSFSYMEIVHKCRRNCKSGGVFLTWPRCGEGPKKHEKVFAKNSCILRLGVVSYAPRMAQ